MEEKKWYLTLNYQETKDIIRENLESMSRSFIATGYYLRLVRDTEGYKEDGYKDIWEFAADQYGIKRSTASRWMDMNERFSEGGNSPILAVEFKNYQKSQLQEMLYLPDEKIDEVTPDMTVKEIREIRKPEQKELQKPDEKQREYLKLFAKYFIGVKSEWMLQDFQNRVLDVLKSPNEIKGHLGMDHRTWYFSVSGKSAHINLFDEYVQVWDENGEHLGDFEWFYLAAEIQSMWNVVSLEKAQKKIEQQKIGYSEQCLECGLNKNGQAGILECHPEKGEHKCVTGDACDVAQDSENLDETASCPPGQGGCPRMEWGTGPEQQKAGQQECKKCWADYKKYRKAPESTDVVLVQEECATSHSEAVEEKTEPDYIIESDTAEIDMNQEEPHRETEELSDWEIARRTLEEADTMLEELLECYSEDDRIVRKQRVIVEALTGYLANLDKIMNPPEFQEQPELPLLKNNDQRKEWLRNYRDWGLWYEDENIGAKYYPYIFADGTQLIAEEYPSSFYDYISHLHLVGGPSKRPVNQYGCNKYPYHEKYTKYPDSESEVVEFLKHIQKGEKK